MKSFVYLRLPESIEPLGMNLRVKVTQSCQNFLFFVVFYAMTSVSAFSPALRAFGTRTSLCSTPAEKWVPANGETWEEKDYAAELKKLENECTQRLDEKIAELNANIENVGKE